MPGANSVLGNGARRAYGLIWHLLNAGIPLYWIVDPNKDIGGAIDGPDLTISTGSCLASQPAVTLVDQSIPGSYCGLDSLHPLVPSTATLNTTTYPGACQHNGLTDGNGNPLPPGTYPLGTGTTTALSSVSYRGGPFVVDAKDAAQARDIMAWYFSLPPVSNLPASGSPLPPATPIYVNPPVANGYFGDTSPANAGINTWGNRPTSLSTRPPPPALVAILPPARWSPCTPRTLSLRTSGRTPCSRPAPTPASVPTPPGIRSAPTVTSIPGPTAPRRTRSATPPSTCTSRR